MHTSRIYNFVNKSEFKSYKQFGLASYNVCIRNYLSKSRLLKANVIGNGQKVYFFMQVYYI